MSYAYFSSPAPLGPSAPQELGATVHWTALIFGFYALSTYHSTGFPSAPPSQCLEERLSLGKALIQGAVKNKSRLINQTINLITFISKSPGAFSIAALPRSVLSGYKELNQPRYQNGNCRHFKRFIFSFSLLLHFKHALYYWHLCINYCIYRVI